MDNKNSAPKVTVILTSYNQAQYVAQAIQSVLNQTFTDFELFIVDDGSTDNSQEIIKTFTDPRIKFFLYRKNLGALKAIKEPINSANGKYIATQHSDDLWTADKLEKQVDFLEKNPDYAACFTQAEFIDETGNLYELPETHPYHNIFEQKNRTREEWLNYLFWNMSSFCTPSSLVVNDKNFSSFNTCLFQLSDYFIWLNVCKNKNIYVLNEKLTKFRLRRTVQNTMSSLSLEKVIRNKNESYFMAKEFLSLTNNVEEFLKIFPEAEKYFVEGEIDTKFAFAKLCLEHTQSAFQKFGLEVLYDSLRNQSQASKLKKLYNYDERNFIADTGKYDVFGVRFQHHILHSRLYFDTGEEFNQRDSVEKIVLVKPDETFQIKFDVKLEKPVKKLRFDPDDEKTFFAIKFTKILVNNKQITDYFSNEFQIIDGWHIFLTSDPSIIMEQEVTEKNLCVEIFGIIEFESKGRIEKFFAEKEKENESQIKKFCIRLKNFLQTN